MWWSAVVYQLKHRLLTTRKAGVWLSIGPSTLNGNKICTATVLATIFYVTFCLGASCLRLDLHCILTAVPQTPNNPAPMTQIILHQPHRTPKKLLPLISVCPLIYCPLKLEETSIEPLHMRSSPKHNNNKIGPHDLTDVYRRYAVRHRNSAERKYSKLFESGPFGCAHQIFRCK